MSIATVVTGGFGAYGTIAFVTRDGYGVPLVPSLIETEITACQWIETDIDNVHAAPLEIEPEVCVVAFKDLS